MSVLALFVLLLAGAEAVSLVARAVDGDRRAVRRLVGRLLPVIRSRVRAFLAPRSTHRIGAHDLDDISQDIWTTLFADEGRMLRNYDPARGMSLEGYVGMVSQRETWRRWEQHRAAKRGGGRDAVGLDRAPEPVEGRTPEQRVMSAELATGLRAHLWETLPPRGRAVLVGLYEDGATVEEVCDLLGVKRQVVYNWRHRIRKASAAWLEAHG